MSTGTAQYEFTPEQDAVVASLGHKMGWVGCFLLCVGLLNLVGAGLTAAVAFRDQLPPAVKEKIDEYAGAEADRLEVEVAKVGDKEELAVTTASSAINGLLTLLFGVWIRGAGVSFGRIARTEGRDISNLMRGLGSLNRMFGLVFGLLAIGLLLLVMAVGALAYAYLTTGAA